jgi:hypothetical protein
MPLPPPTRGGTLQKSKNSDAAAPTATSTSTGPCMMGRLTRKDDVEAGVPLTTKVMMMAVTTTMVEALPRCPTGLGTSSRPPSKGARKNLAPRGLWRPPHRDQDLPGVGGVGTPKTGPDDHCDPNRGKIKEDIEGGEDECCNFERV